MTTPTTADLRALVAKLDNLDRRGGLGYDAHDLLRETVAALPALLDRLEVAELDAERYRWLERFDHLTQVNSMLNGIEYTTLNVAVDTAREWELALSDAAREGE